VKLTPRLAITMGDAGGIGPEVVVRALALSSTRTLCRPVVIGDIAVLRKSLRRARVKVCLIPVHDVTNPAASSTTIPVVNPCAPIRAHRWGVVRSAYGAAAMEYVRFAVGEALSGAVDGIVTAPICKEAIHRAGFDFEGHTDYLAHLTGTRDYAMMLTGQGLSVILVTIHRALAEVSGALSRSSILRAIRLAHHACERLGARRPKIGVCGFNPHAGEAGAFGSEEREKIVPAIRAAVREGISAEGPFPADTLFVEKNRKRFDAIVAMYHDQGLIPLKMLAFDTGVNVTLGLPIVRTSPDHGTAFDIAGRGIADPRSMAEAIKFASRMCGHSHA